MATHFIAGELSSLEALLSWLLCLRWVILYVKRYYMLQKAKTIISVLYGGKKMLLQKHASVHYDHLAPVPLIRVGSQDRRICLQHKRGIILPPVIVWSYMRLEASKETQDSQLTHGRGRLSNHLR